MQFFCEFIDLEFIQGKLDDALLTSKSSPADLIFCYRSLSEHSGIMSYWEVSVSEFTNIDFLPDRKL